MSQDRESALEKAQKAMRERESALGNQKHSEYLEAMTSREYSRKELAQSVMLQILGNRGISLPVDAIPLTAVRLTDSLLSILEKRGGGEE